MFRGENLIGMLLLLLCVVVGAIMVQAIATGDTPTIPGYMKIPAIIIGVGGMLLLLWNRFSGRFRGK